MSDEQTQGCGCNGGSAESCGGANSIPVEIQPSERRTWLIRTTYVLGALAALASGIPIVGFLFGPLRRRGDDWIAAGKTSDFPKGETRLVNLENPLRKATDGDTGKVAVYVRNIDDATFQVFSVYCTHLGCPVNWFPEAGLFMCPCHGGAYYDDGSRASGPPPRGLFEFAHQVEEGQLKIKIGHLPTLNAPA